MPINIDIPRIPENPNYILPKMTGTPNNIAGCSLSEIDGIMKYIDKITTQITELNYRMNLPSDCTIVDIPKLMIFMKKNPNFSIPTKEEISSDVKNITKCSEKYTYLQKKSNQLEEMLNIITELKSCRTKSAIDSMAAIDYQTQSIKNKIPDLDGQTTTYAEKTKYQTEMYNSVKYVNEILLIFYALLFSIIHILFLVQYVQGVKRDAVSDTIWLTVFFLYPYLIYYVEKTVYSIIMYFLSLIYGTTYVYQFDKLFLFTDFYYDPNAKK